MTHDQIAVFADGMNDVIERLNYLTGFTALLSGLIVGFLCFYFLKR